MAKVSYNPEKVTMEMISNVLKKNGFSLIVDKDKKLAEEIKRSVIDLIHNTTYNAMVRNSDYLEKFIIQQRIEKVKSLIHEGQLTLSEIAYMMGYSSVQYLSTQFKNITGVSVTDYKKRA